MMPVRSLIPFLLTACVFGPADPADTADTGTVVAPPPLDAACFDAPTTEGWFHGPYDGALPRVTDGSPTQNCEVQVVYTGEVQTESVERYDACGRLSQGYVVGETGSVYRHELTPGMHAVWVDGDADGVEEYGTEYAYDVDGRLTSTTFIDVPAGDVRTLEHTYDADGHLILTEDSAGWSNAAYTHTFDGATHTVVTDEDVDGTIDDLRQTTTTATGEEILKGRTSLDYRQVLTTDAEGRVVLREHTDVGTNDWNGTDTFTYDAHGRLLQVVIERPDQLPIVTDYTWTCPW